MKPQQLFLYDAITDESATTFCASIRAAAGAPIELHINSPGGSVFAGYGLYNTLLSHKAGVEVHIDGLAASIASFVAMAGRKIYAAANSMVMLHLPSVEIAGNRADLLRLADLLEKITTQMVDAYTNRSGQRREDILNLLEAESWLTAEMALEIGLVDHVTEPLKIAAHFDFSKFHFRNVPPNLKQTVAVPASKKKEAGPASSKENIELTAQVSRLEARVIALTDERDHALKLVSHLESYCGVMGVDPSQAVPSIAQEDGGFEIDRIVTEFEAITDPVARSRFYAKNKFRLVAAAQQLKDRSDEISALQLEQT